MDAVGLAVPRPEANEPSDAAYLVSRISGIVIVAGLVIAFVVAGVRNTDW